MKHLAEGLVPHFSILRDPRVQKRTKHKLVDIIVIAVCAVICGAEGWEDVEEYGKAKWEWLKLFLELPHGIPSDDTFARVFSILDSRAFERCFCSWAETMREKTPGEVVAIDGKTLRGSFNVVSGHAIHLVSAWVVDNELVLGQLKVEEGSSEITAVPKLIDMLDLKGTTVTADAMHCQKQTAKKVIEKGGDYVFCVKANQPEVYQEIESFFSWCQTEQFKNVAFDYFESTDKGHGRLEVRKYWHTGDIAWLKADGEWAGLQSIGMVQAYRDVSGKTSIETRFFISSRQPDAEKFAKAVRGHWQIENGLHWCLDVQMNEDGARIRLENAAENFAVLRRIALNLLKQDKSKKRGLKAKSKIACWDNGYLLRILFGPSQVS